MWRIEKLEGGGEQAWEWYLRLPSFMRWEFEAGDREEFLRSFEKGMNFGGYEDGLKVIVHGEDKGETMEGHLFCASDCPLPLISAAISFGTREALESYRNVLIETASRHKTLRRMLPTVGYTDLGLSAYRGRMVETSHYIAQ